MAVRILTNEKIVLLALFLDVMAVVMRWSSGEWTTEAKLNLLSSHFALLGVALDSLRVGH